MSTGELLGAIASVVGGTIGALGSAAAVFIMLRRQRDDEIDKVSAAVFREIAELCKAPLGRLTICAQIQTKTATVRVRELKDLFRAPLPVIFPAVASLIGRLPCPTLVVTFYAQLQEVRGLVSVIENAAGADEFVGAGVIQGLADLLISQCQHARWILGGQANALREALIGAGFNQMLNVLDEQLAAAREVFPDAPSFQDHQLPTGVSRADTQSAAPT